MSVRFDEDQGFYHSVFTMETLLLYPSRVSKVLKRNIAVKDEKVGLYQAR